MTLGISNDGITCSGWQIVHRETNNLSKAAGVFCAIMARVLLVMTGAMIKRVTSEGFCDPSNESEYSSCQAFQIVAPCVFVLMYLIADIASSHFFGVRVEKAKADYNAIKV